jgi:hypothetical protein
VVALCLFTATLPAFSFAQSEGAEIVLASRPIGPLAYRPGRGLRIGETGLTLGGYSTIGLDRDEGQAAKLGLDELSFFVIWDPLARLHFFSELEFEDLLHVNTDGEGGTDDARFLTERLHGDFSWMDQATVRAGKFLTPIGRWNVIHAQPLVWTTSRPLVTSLPFDPHVTGASVFGSVFPNASAVNYSLYGQFVNQLDPDTSFPVTTDRGGGARVEHASRHGPAIGTSYYGFTSAGAWHHLWGLDLLWRHQRFELMGEFAYQLAVAGGSDQWGLYLQPVIELVPRVYAVGRYEHYTQAAPLAAVNLIDLGVAYKPVPSIVLKAEYLIADHVAEQSPPGVKGSFAILF